MPHDKPIVLFLCGGNSCRSQIGEAYLRKYAGDLFDVHSAGLDASGGIHPTTVTVLEEAGFDLSSHRAKEATEYLGELPVHTLIIVCDAAAKKCPSVWPGIRERLVWPFEDPPAFDGDEEAKLPPSAPTT
jgi:arsenate reductase